MNNPTERDQQIAREAAFKLHHFGRAPQNEGIILAAIQDANQQGNEDTARLRKALEQIREQRPIGKCTIPDCWPCKMWQIANDTLDAARGVQPAAKECPPWIREIGDLRRASEAIAAQQESAPAMSPETAGKIIGAFSHSREAGMKALAEYRAQSAPAAEQVQWEVQWKQQGCAIRIKHKLIHVGSYGAAIELVRLHNLAVSAPSPAQDKPVAASVEMLKWRTRIINGTEYEAIVTADGSDIGECGPWAFKPHVAKGICIAHNRALTASSPSEQKSSLPECPACGLIHNPDKTKCSIHCFCCGHLGHAGDFYKSSCPSCGASWHHQGDISPLGFARSALASQSPSEHA